MFEAVLVELVSTVVVGGGVERGGSVKVVGGKAISAVEVPVTAVLVGGGAPRRFLRVVSGVQTPHRLALEEEVHSFAQVLFIDVAMGEVPEVWDDLFLSPSFAYLRAFINCRTSNS